MAVLVVEARETEVSVVQGKSMAMIQLGTTRSGVGTFKHKKQKQQPTNQP